MDRQCHRLRAQLQGYDLQVDVNGRKWVLSGLKDGERQTLDVSSAMQPGNGNVIILTAHGKPGGSAEVAIYD